MSMPWSRTEMYTVELNPIPETVYADDGLWETLIDEVGRIIRFPWEQVPMPDGSTGVITHDGVIFPEPQEILVPMFEMVSCPTIKLSEVKARRFYIVDQAQIHAKEQIQKEEDEAIFNSISAAVQQ